MKRTRMIVPAAIAILAVSTTIALKANDDKSDTEQFKFQPNSLVLSRSVYTGTVPSDQLVTSFSSKSELAINLASDGKSITFVGYHGGPGFLTAPNQLDVSNSSTPGAIDPTNPVTSNYYRSVAEVDANGQITVTDGNAYSGNNGRAAFKSAPYY